MTPLDAFLLGIVQGLTEFLPVSSSGHLVLFQQLLGINEPMLYFDVAAHLGTLIAVTFYFFSDIRAITIDSWRGLLGILRKETKVNLGQSAPRAVLGLGIILATLPAVAAGLLWHDWFESLFGSLRGVAIAFFGTSLILWIGCMNQQGVKKIEKGSWLDFLIIGLMQAVAIIPGISRSGSTISAGLIRGFEREDAFRFSFLLSLPAVLGAIILETAKKGLDFQNDLLLVGIGILTAGFTGYWALGFLSRMIKKGKLGGFAVYMLAAGCVSLFLSFR